MKNPVRFGQKLGATKWELQVIILDFLESNGILSKYLRKIGLSVILSRLCCTCSKQQTIIRQAAWIFILVKQPLANDQLLFLGPKKEGEKTSFWNKLKTLSYAAKGIP